MTERPPKIQTIRHYLKPIRTTYKAKIGRVFRRKLDEQGVARKAGGGYPCNRKTREILADSIFEIEDELESKCGGQADHPAVVEMRTARGKVNVDLMWDDP